MTFDPRLAAIAAEITSLEKRIPPEPSTPLEHARWRDECARIPDEDAMRTVIYEAFRRIELPPIVEHPDATAPFVITREIAEDFVTCFASKTFPRLREKILNNMMRISSKPVYPKEYKGELIDYFKGTPLTKLFDIRIPIVIKTDTRLAGTWVIGPSNTGKTTLLHSLILRDLQTDASVILMDSKATGQNLIDPYKTLKAIKNTLIVIEPSANLALNPFSLGGQTVKGESEIVRVVELVSYIYSSLLQTTLTPKQTILFRSVLRAAMHFPNPTIHTVEDILKSGVPQHIQIGNRLRSFFDNDFTQKGKGGYSDTIGEIQWRLNLLLENPIMEGMLSAPKTKLDLARVMNNHTVLVIDANRDKVGALGCVFLQRLVIALILDAAQRRVVLRDYQKRPCFVYIDECDSAISNDEKVPEILEKCRSAGVSLTLAHQGLHQIESNKVKSALFNCAVKYANVDNDARVLAPFLRIDPEVLASLPRGTFAAFAKGQGAFQVRPPHYDLTQLTQMTPDEQADFDARMREEYYYSEDKIAAVPPKKSRWFGRTPQNTAEHTGTITEAPPEDDLSKSSKNWRG